MTSTVFVLYPKHGTVCGTRKETNTGPQGAHAHAFPPARACGALLTQQAGCQAPRALFAW